MSKTSPKVAGSSMVSLDVLAHVATATLEETGDVDNLIKNESGSETPDVEYVIEGGQDFPDHILQGIQSLTLEAIHSLSINALTSLFTNLLFEKERQAFICSCAFLPGKCQTRFSSYGSEKRAVASMQTHLAHHLFQLLQESQKDSSIREKYFPTVFFDAPFPREVTVSFKDLEKANLVDQDIVSLEHGDASTSAVRPQPEMEIAVNMDYGVVSDHAYGLGKIELDVEEEGATFDQREAEEGTDAREELLQRQHQQLPQHQQHQPQQQHQQQVTLMTDSDGSTIIIADAAEVDLTGAEVEVETVETDEEANCQLPFHHFGGRKKVTPMLPPWKRCQVMGDEGDDDDDEESDLSRFAHDHAYTFSKPPEPPQTRPASRGRFKDSMIGPTTIQHSASHAHAGALEASQFIPATETFTGNTVFLPIVDGQIILDKCVENQTYLISEDAEILTAVPAHDSHQGTNTTRRPDYPPMPHSNYGTVKLHIQEEWEPTTAEEERFIEDDQRIIQDPAGPSEEDRSDEDWVKRTALKYIRYLRGRKKKDNYVLSCRICNDGKIFTAAATLLYHYRSHAGIKAFICQICNTSFTRQHSLNYHMLIHNGQSRFTCDDCGRQFRHPQHYKEHLRRHTGETPFTCGDCGATFKTRNTFKRHLRTRHEKLLTADGIRLLSDTELRNLKMKEIKREVPTVQEIPYQFIKFSSS